MSIYKFSDGTEYNLFGTIKKEKRTDGWYIIINDLDVKVNDEASADSFIKIYNRDKNKCYIINQFPQL